MPSDLPLFGRYQALQVIGRGAMGVVYRAHDPLLKRDVAVKTIPLPAGDDERERQLLLGRIVREIQSAGALSHPNIARVHDVGEIDGELFIVMELCAGPSLEKLTQDGIDVERAPRIIAETAAALDYAHQNGVVHRDVKPANILTDADGRAKLVDFGIAKTLASAKLTRTGTMVGTPEYMAPEQLRDAEAGPASDQYALAATAFKALTGRVPFDAPTVPELLKKIVREDPPSAAGVPPHVASALKRGLSKQPEKRFGDCAELAAALRPRVAAPIEPKQSSRGVLVAASVALLAVAVGATYWITRTEPLAEGRTAIAPAVAPPAESPTAPPPHQPEREPEPVPDQRRGPEPPVPRPRAQAPPAPEPPAPTPKTLVPTGPVVEVIWRGELGAEATLTIVDGKPDSGALSAPLPTAPFQLEISPPGAVEVVQAPAESNNWSRLEVRNRGRTRRLFLIRYQVLEPDR